MPGFLVHETTVALCPHLGKAAPTTTAPRVTVLGRPVVTETSVYTVDGCKLPAMVPAALPCATASFVTASLRVRATGQPVLLTSSRAVTVPNEAPLIVIPGQTRVQGL